MFTTNDIFFPSGVNKSDVADYPRVSDQCAFFNNKFLIFSSLGSFFIPCIIIFAIYYRIFMVIMARARKNRKQWRPKAAIQSAAAQHRTNVNHLVSGFRHDSTQPSSNNDLILSTNSTLATKPTMLTNESTFLTTKPKHNTLMLQLSTPVISSNLRSSINVTSSSGDALDDDERDDIALFVQHEQEETFRKLRGTDNSQNPIETHPLPSPPPPPPPPRNKSLAKIIDHTMSLPTATRSSQTENHLPCDYLPQDMKTRLKTRTNADGSPITTTISPNNSKNTKRKVYSRMKKERKATQTLIIVLSMCISPDKKKSFFLSSSSPIQVLFSLVRLSNEFDYYASIRLSSFYLLLSSMTFFLKNQKTYTIHQSIFLFSFSLLSRLLATIFRAQQFGQCYF